MARKKTAKVLIGMKMVNANYSLRAIFDGKLIDHSASNNENWFSSFYMTMKLCSIVFLDFLKTEIWGHCIDIA